MSMSLLNQQNFLDRELAWKHRLLATTKDGPKRESILRDIDALEALRETLRRHRNFIDAVHTVQRMPKAADHLKQP